MAKSRVDESVDELLSLVSGISDAETTLKESVPPEEVNALGNSRRGYASQVTVKHREFVESIEPGSQLSLEKVTSKYNALLEAYRKFKVSHKHYVKAAKSVDPTVDLNTVLESYLLCRENVRTARNSYIQFISDNQVEDVSDVDTGDSQSQHDQDIEPGDSVSQSELPNMLRQFESMLVTKLKAQKEEILLSQATMTTHVRVKLEKQISDQNARIDALIQDQDKKPLVGREPERDTKPTVLNPHANPFIPHESNPSGTVENMNEQNKLLIDTLQLPKVDLVYFDGNPMQYWQFMNTFESCVGNTSVSDGAKLARLMAYCKGKAHKVIEPCALMNPKEGYERALSLLKERFGDEYVIASAWVKHICAGPVIKPGNPKSLQSFADEVASCVETLSAMGRVDEVDSRARMATIVERLPHYIRNRWLRLAVNTREETGSYPSISVFASFMRKMAREANDPVFGIKPETYQPRTSSYNSNASSLTVSSNVSPSASSEAASVHANQVRTQSCGWCDQTGHGLNACKVLKSLSLSDRVKCAKEKRLCFNCLSTGHPRKSCSLPSQCKVSDCKFTVKHSTWLHGAICFPARAEGPARQPEVRTDAQDERAARPIFSACASGSTSICLPVVEILVRGKGQGEFVRARALLDSGSTRSFCSQELADKLELVGNKVSLNLNTLSGSNKTSVSCVSLEVTSIPGVVKASELVSLPSVFVMEEFPSIVTASRAEVEGWEHLKDLGGCFASVDEVSLLIGQDVPQALVPVETRTGLTGEPYAIRTVLGWTVNGPLSSPVNNPVSFLNVSSFHANLDLQVEQFWKLDIGPSLACGQVQMSQEDKQVLERWDKNAKFEQGHYTLEIPFRHEPPEMPNNYCMAKARLLNLKRKLERDNSVYQRYQQEIDTLKMKGYVEEVPSSQASGIHGCTWYLPHHGVVNPNKPEKLRLVFDAAATYNGTALNKQVLQGPDLTNKLVGVLLRFREGPVAIMADVEAMFHQVCVPVEQRDVLRFLWLGEKDFGDPKILRFTVHPFGGIWSPSAANYALRRAATDQLENFDSETVNTVLENCYVDDMLKACDSVESAIQLTGQISGMLAQGGFHLTKWLSNKREVVKNIASHELAKNFKDLDLERSVLPVERALGVKWQVESDRFMISVKCKASPFTKRGLLSVLSSVYDPLGIVAPVVLAAKILFQNECKLDKKWDDPVELITQQRWVTWLEELPSLEKVTIPRCFVPQGMKPRRYQLHTFCDASQVAYGTTSYLRMEDEERRVHCALVLGKARLAPLKTMTIPRLELSAAVLAVRVNAILSRELHIVVDETYYWSDSMVVLQYIRSRVRRFNTFVANRLAVIHDGSDVTQWKYVDSANNPADDASRGLSVQELVTSERWVQGPDFLWRDQACWPVEPGISNEVAENDPEVKREVRSYVLAQHEVETRFDTFLTRYSCWYRLQRAVCWLIRFICWLRHGKSVTTQLCQTAEELAHASQVILVYIQSQRYPKELEALKSNKAVPKSSDIRDLDPFLDHGGLIRVGGRLREAAVPEGSKHPIVLPRDHPVTTLVVRRVHERDCIHGGREHVLSRIREDYWIPRPRLLVDRVLSRCTACRRFKGKPVGQRMADLPPDRVNPDVPAFAYVGVDCFGPFCVKRGRSEVKRYGCLFTCLRIRAVHIEVLHSLEADSFINALVRFSARRGRIMKLRSDNATNFTCGSKELREAIEAWNISAKLQSHLLQEQVTWEFNPPTASHMGGVWERQIRTVRKVLNFVLKGQVLTDEGLSTLMCEVETTINSRPITSVSNDVRDQEPLTPNHLLLLRSGPSLPPGKFSKDDVYRRRWRHAQFLADVFWKRWTREYLPSLQARTKWQTVVASLQPGDVVLIADETCPRRKWPLCKVLEAYKGRDGLVRSVKLRTATNVVVRPVSKICLLESVNEM